MTNSVWCEVANVIGRVLAERWLRERELNTDELGYSNPNSSNVSSQESHCDRDMETEHIASAGPTVETQRN